MVIALYLVFLLSGAAGLMYESIWTRYLGLFVGHDAYAQIIVLVIFLGGMSLGAMLVGRWSTRIANPLLAYALVEFVVGLIGLFFHDIYGGVTGFAYRSLFPAMAGSSSLVVVKWALAGALILPQSVLLGATFPLMSAGVLRIARVDPGRVLSLLYFTNSLGAAVGVLVAGFYLIAVAGLPGVLIAAAIINLAVALVTLFVMVRWRARSTEESAAAWTPPPALARTEGSAGIPAGRLRRLLLTVCFGTAVASFIYEIAWIRMLSLVLGAATHSFELMLSAFILGLALGAFWIRRRADAWADPVRALAVVQVVMGALALATLPVYLASFGWTADLLAVFARSGPGYSGFTLSRYALCMLVMIPATFCAGMTLPLITRILLVSGSGERAIGTVYSFNTLGSILGVALAGLVLMPVLGLKWMLILGAAIDMGLGVALLWSAPGRRPLAFGALGIAAGVAALAAFTQRFDPNVLSSSVYRTGNIPPAGSRQFLYYRDGRTATVAATIGVRDSLISIATNGKPDASLGREWYRPCGSVATPSFFRDDASTQTMAALLTLAYAPAGPKNGAVIGQGSGMTSHLLLASPDVRHLVTVEIEPAMIEGSRMFYPANRRVFDDPRSEFVIEDAKAYFASANQKYDLIFSEPSNPWVSGVSLLFTTEFYRRIRQYLTDGGVFVQWIHLYEMDDGLILSVLAAIHENFPSYRIHLSAGTDIMIVASSAPALRTPDWTVTELPDLRHDACNFVRFSSTQLAATQLMDRAALAPLLDDYRGRNSDFYPVLDLGTERARYQHTYARGFVGLSADRFAFFAPFFGPQFGPGTEKDPAVPAIPRLRGLALGMRLRNGLVDSLPADGSQISQVKRDAAYRWQQWITALSATRPPTDWQTWIANALVSEEDLHGGTTHYADEGFYGRVYDFLRRFKAPPQAWDAIRFRHGLAAWNFQEASDAADRLIPLAARSINWVNPDELRLGAATAKLARRDVRGARDVLNRLNSVGTIGPDDVRSALIEAYVFAVEKAQGPQAPPGVR